MKILLAMFTVWLALSACTEGSSMAPDTDGATVISVSVTPSRDTITIGGTVRLSAHAATSSNAAPPTISWRSTSPNVASVVDGLVLGASAGWTRILAEAGTMADTAEIWVVSPAPAAVASVAVSPPTASAQVGVTIQLDAVTKDASGNILTGRQVTWASNAVTIASVNGSGLVTAHAAGSAAITATSEGKTGSSSVTVTQVAATVASVSVSPTSSTRQVGQSIQLAATVKDAAGATLSGRTVSWTTSNSAVATVAGNGLVTAIAAGSATITATSEGRSGTSSLTVTAVPPPAEPSTGIWLSAAEAQALPASGPAWDNLKQAADANLAGGVLSTRDEHNVRTMAAGLVALRLNSDVYRAKVRESLRGVMANRIDGGDPLAIVRRLGTYAIAADLINLKTFDPTFDAEFRAWLDRTRKTEYGGETVAAIHERRPNNWGTHAGISRIAVALYLGDRADLERAATVFKGWLGDRSAYAGFTYNEVEWWQADPSKPVGINPKGATRDGHSIDGVLPDDQRRAGAFTWPPQKENYIYTALEGALGEAVLLSRQGYDVWNWSDRALLRAFVWLHDQAKYPAEGNDCWQPVIINRVYGTNFPAPASSSPGKNIGWGDWTHQR